MTKSISRVAIVPSNRQSQSQKGKDVSGSYHVASVWRKRNGDWQTVLHTDMKAQ
jgi:hypothetical protein